MKNNDTYKAFLLPIAVIGILCAPVNLLIVLVIASSLTLVAIEKDKSDSKQNDANPKRNYHIERAFVMLGVTVIGAMFAAVIFLGIDMLIDNMEDTMMTRALYITNIAVKIMIACLIFLVVLSNVHAIIKGDYNENDKNDKANNA
ncbi:hypothetical protein [Mogibacterium diversum]|uniref:hypothetical protein n=1 Tax=Mogibacterium diversum TaxID=114527 RepID=UPI0028D774D7|nr:hypothetical protein [Mogibacterium diversum]